MSEVSLDVVAEKRRAPEAAGFVVKVLGTITLLTHALHTPASSVLAPGSVLERIGGADRPR